MITFNYVYTYVSVCGFMHVCLGASIGQNHRVLLKLELAEVCDLPDRNAGDPARFPYQNSSCSKVLSCISNPRSLVF